MFFYIKNKKYLSPEQLRSNTLLDAYFIIKNYPLHASELAIDKLIQQEYKTTLKNMCIRLLLCLTFYKDNSGNIMLMFKNPQDDKIARLITYGNGMICGSKILKIALHD